MIDTACGNALAGGMAESAAIRAHAPTYSFRRSGGQIPEGAIPGIYRAIIKHETAASELAAGAS